MSDRGCIHFLGLNEAPRPRGVQRGAILEFLFGPCPAEVWLGGPATHEQPCRSQGTGCQPSGATKPGEGCAHTHRPCRMPPGWLLTKCPSGCTSTSPVPGDTWALVQDMSVRRLGLCGPRHLSSVSCSCFIYMRENSDHKPMWVDGVGEEA